MFQIKQNLLTELILPARFFIFSFLALFLLLFSVLLNAWIGDDATITFRQVWNLLSGDGITFNFEQRVQAFSHPLWFWVISFFGFFTRELYITTTLLSVFLTITGTFLLVLTEYTSRRNKLPFISTIVLLPFSWAFVDYSTSGLENALSFFLVGLLLYLLFVNNSVKNLQVIFIILALLFLNRLDYAILFLPLVLYLIWDAKSVKKLLYGIYPGILLIIFWFLFATFYFGSPLPNTFYAKLNAGYPAEEVFLRGLNYFMSMKNDLASVLILLLGISLSLISRNRILISLSIGQFLYMFYIFQAGGDFMMGRFFAILVFLSVGQIVLALNCLKKWKIFQINYFIFASLALVIIIGIFQRFPFLLAYDNYESRGPFYGLEYTDHHIVDEKMFYYFSYGLFSPTRETWPIIQPQTKHRPTKYYATCGVIGLKSISDPSFFYVDQCALTDPLISRIPAVHSDIWRIGHHYRKIPTEYGEYVIGNVHEIPDKNINALLKDITSLTSGKLGNLDRISSIWRVNTGYYSDIDFTDYVNKDMWVPKTIIGKKSKIAKWDNITREIKFDGVINIQSEEPSLATEISFYVNMGNEFEVYVNDKYSGNIVQESKDIPVKINLTELTLVSSIKLRAIKSDYRGMPYIFIRDIKLSAD